MLSALLLPLAACSADEVALPDVGVGPEERTACRSLVDALPADLGDDRERVPVEPADGLGAAWGDPAIVMTCGGEAPELSRTAPCIEANGVGWYVDEAVLTDESLTASLVAAGYRPIVTLEVPAGQRPEGAAAAMAGVAAAVQEHTELVQPCL